MMAEKTPLPWTGFCLLDDNQVVIDLQKPPRWKRAVADMPLTIPRPRR
jgi:hypothetical protein